MPAASQLLSCGCGLQRWFSLQPSGSVASTAPLQSRLLACSGCGTVTAELSRSREGSQKCQHCLRAEDEALLGPLSADEQRGLDAMAGVLDVVSWGYFKPGEQPARVLEWLYLGDLKEAMDFELLKRKGITAVLNVMNWWQLVKVLPEYEEGLSDLYAAHNIDYEVVETEDRMAYDLVGTKWAEVEAILERWRHAGKKVLINCKAGHNRSACFCVCWLVARERMPLLSAVQHVLNIRGTVLSNNGFRLQLVRLALRHGLLDREERHLAPERKDSDRDSEKGGVVPDFILKVRAELAAKQTDAAQEELSDHLQ